MSALRRTARAVHHLATAPQLVLVLLALGAVLLARLFLAAAALAVTAAVLWLEAARAGRADLDPDPAGCPLCARTVRQAAKGGEHR
jgi:cation transporter-like permease